MATKKKKTMAAALGTMSVGKHAVGVGISVARGQFHKSDGDKDLVQAMETLEHARLQVTLTRSAGESGQEQMFGDAELSVDGVADVGQVAVSGGAYKFSLSFRKKECHWHDLGELAQGDVDFGLERVGKAGEKDDEGSEAEAA